MPASEPARRIRSEWGDMGKDITFEAQVRNDGEWRTIGVFGDREAAMSEAERSLEARRTSRARVLQVIFDTDNNRCNEYTVFRATCFEEETTRPRSRVGEVDIFRPNRQRPAARAAYGPLWATITAAALLCLAGLAAMLLFH